MHEAACRAPRPAPELGGGATTGGSGTGTPAVAAGVVGVASAEPGCSTTTEDACVTSGVGGVRVPVPMSTAPPALLLHK